MPTPRPTIVAIVGAMVEISVSPASRVTIAVPTPRPIIATSSGSPAATSEPRPTSRMIRAATMPTASATPLGAETFSGISPPNATV